GNHRLSWHRASLTCGSSRPLVRLQHVAGLCCNNNREEPRILASAAGIGEMHSEILRRMASAPDDRRRLRIALVKGWRLYFKIDHDTYIITRIIPPPQEVTSSCTPSVYG